MTRKKKSSFQVFIFLFNAVKYVGNIIIIMKNKTINDGE